MQVHKATPKRLPSETPLTPQQAEKVLREIVKLANKNRRKLPA